MVEQERQWPNKPFFDRALLSPTEAMELGIPQNGGDEETGTRQVKNYGSKKNKKKGKMNIERVVNNPIESGTPKPPPTASGEAVKKKKKAD